VKENRYSAIFLAQLEMRGNEMQIDPIRLEEVSVLQELATQTFAETFAHDNDPKKLEAFFEEAYSLEVLTSELSDSNCQHYFLRVDHQIAGYLKLNQGPAQTEHELENAFEIQRIYLLKAYQGQGLGKKLFEFALEKCIELGISDFYPIKSQFTQKKSININRLELKTIAALKQSKQAWKTEIHPEIPLTKIISTDFDNYLC
jgi:GNAT superfamily N-acetyltransferase